MWYVVCRILISVVPVDIDVLAENDKGLLP